jgi:hypothetical protein
VCEAGWRSIAKKKLGCRRVQAADPQPAAAACHANGGADGGARCATCPAAGSTALRTPSPPTMPWKPPAPAPKCPKCGKSVYAQEEVLGCGQKWHKACYTCGLCKRPLAKGMELEFVSLPCAVARRLAGPLVWQCALVWQAPTVATQGRLGCVVWVFARCPTRHICHGGAGEMSCLCSYSVLTSRTSSDKTADQCQLQKQKGEDGVTRPYCTKPCHATVSGLGGFRAGGGATGTGATGIGKRPVPPIPSGDHKRGRGASMGTHSAAPGLLK